MLVNLTISNYALIKKLSLTPSSNLNTITGETGAGKSIMLGAMSLLLGKRADSKVLFNENEKCVVEGIFNILPYKLHSFFEQHELDYADETIVRREISSSGKSRAFINDTPVTLDVLKNVMINLIDIHSQHDTLLLADNNMQLKIIDYYAQNQSKLTNYQQQYLRYKNISQQLQHLLINKEEQAKEFEFNKFQFNELERAQLSSQKELENWEEELKMAENAEQIKTTLFQIAQAGNGDEQTIIGILDEVKTLLKSITSFSIDLENIYQRLNSASIELADIFSEIEYKEQEVNFDPLIIEEIRGKVDIINSLLHKYRVFNVDDLIKIKEELQLKIRDVEEFDDRVVALQKQLKQEQKVLTDLALELTSSRVAIIQKLQTNIEAVLKELGMPNASFKVSRNEITFTKDGVDDIQILFSANKGVEAQPLKQVASGGEFSRLMFTIKYLLASKTAMPTIIFDEIDTGISGEIAIKMGKMMRKMAENHQVITITHLPQVAALGHKHYFVFKEETENRTYSQIKQLEGAERETEIAKMISGDKPSAIAFENARELLSLNT